MVVGRRVEGHQSGLGNGTSLVERPGAFWLKFEREFTKIAHLNSLFFNFLSLRSIFEILMQRTLEEYRVVYLTLHDQN